MKTIEQQTKVNFNAIEINDAIKVVALMDTLKTQLNKWENYNKYNNLSVDERNSTERVWKPKEMMLDLTEEQTKALFELLTNLGFCTSY